jgi:hypothetical protein
VDLETAAEELYGLPADEFAEHRTRLAKQARAAGEKALAASIGKLRKPVAAAALVNELVRQEPAELRELTRLGEQMRQAHRELRGPDLRALSEQRQHLLQRLTDLVRETGEQGGRPVTDAVLAQVRGTFDAAIADEAAEAAVLSGRLTTVLSYTGFGEVDVTDAVAAPVRKRHLTSVPDPGESAERAPARKTPAEKAATPTGKAPTDTGSTGAAPGGPAEQAHQRRTERHQQQLRRAEAEHAEATRALEQAQREAQSAHQQHQDATARVEQLRAELDQAQEEAWRAGQASRSAERARQAAEQEAEYTADALKAAREQLNAD